MKNFKKLLISYYKAREKFNLIYHKHYVIELFEDYGINRFKIFLHDLIEENLVCIEIPFHYINEVSVEKVLEAYNLLINELPNKENDE